MRPSLPLSLVCFRSSVSSRFHFPASLRSTVVIRFLTTTDALTSAGRLFGPSGHEHRPVPVRKFTAYPDSVSCHSRSSHPLRMPRLFRCHRFVHLGTGLLPQSLGLSPTGSLGFRSRLRVYTARSPIAPYRIEFTVGAVRLRAFGTGSSLPVALHGQLSPPQFLSATGPVDFGLTGTFTPLRRRLHSRTMPLLTELGNIVGWSLLQILRSYGAGLCLRPPSKSAI